MKGFEYLFHANSLETSLSYFAINSFASRGYIERQSEPQSKQFTDAADKKYGVWNDIFLNFHDHHRRFKRPNGFGPVLFRIPVASLERALPISATMSVCKKNVEGWSDSDSQMDRWVPSISDLENYFKKGSSTNDPISRFFKDGKFCDLVLGNLNVLSLNIIDKVIIEKAAGEVQHFDQFNVLLKTIWPQIYQKMSIIELRENCPADCLCSNGSEFQSAKSKTLFSFGQWESRYPELLPATKFKINIKPS